MKKRGLIIAGIILIILALAIGIYFKFSSSSDFSITPDYPIKMNLVPGAEAKTLIKITNNEKETNNFQIKLNGLSEIASLSESEFSLGSKESKEIEITFKDSQNVSHIYFANLIVVNEGFKKTAPVLLTFEEPAHLFTIIQKPMPRYFDVSPGGKLGVDINVFDLGLKDYSKEIKANYEILSPEKTILSSAENLVISDEFSFSKIFDISSDIEYGDYVLVTSMEYNGIKSISSYLFKIEPKPKGVSFDKINFLILIFFAFVILIVVLFIYFIKSRDELLLQLRKQQSKELTRNIKLIEAIQKKAPEVKKEKFESVKKQVVKKIKKKQEKQIKELTRLRKRKVKKNTLQTQIKKWENEGYNFPEIKRELPEKNINKQIAEWKKKGFDISALA
ncbi:MAG: hypothetical protein AABY06_01945 [Nanoarchaeota archaeon]